jgi:hypothetical protein
VKNSIKIETIQRALSKGISDFIPAIDSSYTQAMYDLEKELSRTCFSDDGAASYP